MLRLTFVNKLFPALFCLLSLFNNVSGHSNLAYPLPTRELHCRVGAQHGRDCHGPCPRLDEYGRLNHPISGEYATATWRRGETVTIRWHRDNHDGTGFVRLSLVPIESMMDKQAHDKLAFYFTCMGTGLHRCINRSFDACGNDREGRAWQSRVEIPRVYKDGIYVLGWSWYGGGDYRDYSFFGDYYSCSFIRIQGGLSLINEYKAGFHSGTKCKSSVDRLGVCWKEACNVGYMSWMIPIEFQNKDHMKIVKHSDVLHYSKSAASTSSNTGSNVISLGARGRRDGHGGKGGIVGISSNNKASLSVKLLDLNTRKMLDIIDGSKYDKKQFVKGFTIQAFYDGDLKKLKLIEFWINGKLVRKERRGPFVINGNNKNRIHAWKKVPIGHMFKLQVYVISREDDLRGGFSDLMFESDLFIL